MAIPERYLTRPNQTEGEAGNPYGNHFFKLEVNGTEVGHFVECSGLKSTTTVFEIEEGGNNSFTHKRPGVSKWENIRLKYATATSTFLLEWRDDLLQDRFDLRPNYYGSISLINNAGEVVRRWTFQHAWPVSWEGPSLSSHGSELSIETLEIAHDGLTISNA
jgi:phage tail-like protein